MKVHDGKDVHLYILVDRPETVIGYISEGCAFDDVGGRLRVMMGRPDGNMSEK